jgi:hypothetical protein
MPLGRSSGMHSQSDMAASLLSMPSGFSAAAVVVKSDHGRLPRVSPLDPAVELPPDISVALLI